MTNDQEKASRNQSPPSEGCPQDGVGNRKILTTIDSISIFRKFTSYLPADKSLRSRARALRKRGNLPEIIFWQKVHRGKFYSIDFDRQRVIGSYIVDFYVKGLSLIVEIDGASHNDRLEYDTQRENFLKNLGLKIWKTSSTEVMIDVDRVMNNLKDHIIHHYS